MCTVVVLRRPGHDWPLILAANRDEMAERPSAAAGAPLAGPARGGGRPRPPGRRYLARSQRLRCRRRRPQPPRVPGSGARLPQPRRIAPGGPGSRRGIGRRRGAFGHRDGQLPVVQRGHRRPPGRLLVALRRSRGRARPGGGGRGHGATDRALHDHRLRSQRQALRAQRVFTCRDFPTPRPPIPPAETGAPGRPCWRAASTTPTPAPRAR